MSRRLPPLNPLRAFEATARNRSLSKAARELSVTHGAVSHQIRALERTLKIRLFERAGPRLKLTEQGPELLPSVMQAFDAVKAAEVVLKGETAGAPRRRTRRPTAGTLYTACVPAVLNYWLIPRLAAFTAQFPDIRLTIAAANDPATIQSPDIDVSILYGDGSWTGCWLKLWTRIELFPVVSPALINKPPIRSASDLAAHTLLHADDGHEWHIWLTAADALDLERGRQHHFAHAGLAIEAALHGFGVALGDSMTAPHLLARGQLVTPFALSVPAVDDFYIACRNDLRHTPIVDAFISWLFREIEEERSRAAVAATPRPAAASQRPAASRKPAAPKKKRRRP